MFKFTRALMCLRAKSHTASVISLCRCLGSPLHPSPSSQIKRHLVNMSVIVFSKWHLLSPRQIKSPWSSKNLRKNTEMSAFRLLMTPSQHFDTPGRGASRSHRLGRGYIGKSMLDMAPWKIYLGIFIIVTQFIIAITLIHILTGNFLFWWS